MIVKKREWLSEVAQEAILIIRSGAHQCAAFSHPCSLNIGDIVTKPLLAVSVDRLYKESCDSEPFISQIENGLEHDIMAKIVDIERKIVRVDNFVIEIDGFFPRDIENGDVVFFHCFRIDAFQ